MTLLGGGFSIGTSTMSSSAAAPVDMSLDDMIASRRRQDRQTSNADRSVATGRARRKAAMDARRGITQSSKPTKMQIEREVEKQQVKTAVAETKKQGKKKVAATAKMAPKVKAEARKKQRENAKVIAKAAKKEQAAATSKQQKGKTTISAPNRPPSKKAVKAAVNAMEGAGFKIPEGMQMVISFAPTAEPSTGIVIESTKNNNQGKKKGQQPKKTQQQQQQQQRQKTAPKGRKGRGRGGGRK